MLSISRLQNISQALTYYKKDNYYANDDKAEHTEWFGKAAEDLCLKGNVTLNDFNNTLNGQTKDGEYLVKKKEKDPKLSYESYFDFKANCQKIIKEINIEDDLKLELEILLSKLSATNDKKTCKKIDISEKKISSIINKSHRLSIDEKEKYKDEVKKEIKIFRKSIDRRIAYDLTFSAPKSVSVAALVGNDDEIIEAHRNAVKYALKIVENEYSQTRIVENNKKSLVRTGNIAVAMFEHDISRKIDPQLHTHCVVMNLTENSGKWRSLNQDGFYYNSKKIGAIYQNELAKNLIKLGYDIKLNANGTFDIKGYTNNQLLHFSKRSAQLRELGAQTQKEATKIVKIKRDKKEDGISKESIRTVWKKDEELLNLSHPVRANRITDRDEETLKNDLLKKLISDSVLELTENEISLKKDSLQEKILTKSLGVFDYNVIKFQTNDYLNKNAHSVGDPYRYEYVTNNSLEVEKETISIMNRGKDIFESVLTLEEFEKIFNGNDEIQNLKSLKDGQRNAVKTILMSNDRITAWQGVAGAGKSYTLSIVHTLATAQGFTVKGFAPQAEAAKTLALEAKLNSAQTIASLLVEENKPGRAEGKEIWIVDEAGLLNAKDAHLLLRKAEIENARILLVGDTKQLSSVGAGNPFKQLQEHGIKLAHLTESIRQKDHTMKKSVDLISKGEHKIGLEILEKSGKVHEIKDTEKIIAHMAKDYLDLNKEELKKSIFISSTNYEKEQITHIVRSELKRKEILKESVQVKIFKNLGYNEFSLKSSNVYSVNDILILNKSSNGLKANQEYKVLEINNTKNTVILQDMNKVKEVSVSQLKGHLFREKEIELSIGDKLKWTKNHSVKSVNTKNNISLKKERRLNGQSLNIIAINKENSTALVEYDNGKQENIDINKSLFLDYNYVSTIHSSQGKSCHKVYASITRVDRENFYVAVSRAEYDCKLYTNDKSVLYKNIERFGANKTAFEKIAEKIKINSIEDINEHSKIEKVVKKFSENDLENIKISRKIKEKSFEVTYKLGLEPHNKELCMFSKFGECNQTVIANTLHYEVNKSLGIKSNSERHSLPIETLKQTYSKDLSKHAIQCQSFYHHKMVPSLKNTQVQFKQKMKI